jgi:hypothetical protein
MTSPNLTVVQKAAKSVNNVERKLRSNPIFVCVIIATFMSYTVVLVLNLLAINPDYSLGLFQNGLTSIPTEFILNFTPAEWSFWIWGVIHLLQLTWMLYTVGLVCRSVNQEPAYLNPVVLSPAFFIFFNLTSIFSIGWLLLWDKLLFLASFVFLACIALSLLLSVSIVCSRLAMLREVMMEQDRRKEYTFLQVVIINSLAMNIAWTLAMAVVNFSIILVYKWHQPISNESTSIICVGVFIFISVVYIGLDSTILLRYTKYAVSPYIVIIWTVAASLSQNYNPGNLSSLLSLFLIGAVSFAFLIKLGLTFLRSSAAKGQYRLLREDHSDNSLQ